MDFSRLFEYIIEDKQWLGKLVPLVFVMAMALVPILGLLPLAVGLGYMVHIAMNVREGLPRPLPKWTNVDEMVTRGAQVLVAAVVWNLPLILLSACSAWMINGIGGGLVGSTAAIVWCCALPFLVAYFVVMWSLLAVGVTEFIETSEAAAMYRVVHLWDVASANRDCVMQWVVFATLVNLLLIALLLVPCLGWVLALGMAMPLHGHLLGQFARKIGIQNKPQPRHRKKQRSSRSRRPRR